MGRRGGGDIDRDEVLGELRRVAATLERPVTRRDLSGAMSWAVLRWFGSISAVREATGVAQPDLNTK